MEKEHYSDDKIICPECDCEWDTSEYEPGYHEEECEECGKKFHLNIDFHLTYDTSADCELNGEAHDYSIDKEKCQNHLLGKVYEHDTNSIYAKCTKCCQTSYIDKSLIK
jgi:hypothetical protein